MQRATLRGLNGTRRQARADCDGNGQQRVTDYLRAKGQIPVNWNAGHTIDSNGWWRRETSSGVFVRNPATGETFVEKITVSDCPSCGGTISEAATIDFSEPLSLDFPLTVNKIYTNFEYDAAAEPTGSNEPGIYGDVFGIPFDGRDIKCNVGACMPFDISELPTVNKEFMKVWAHTNMPDSYDSPPDILTEQDWQQVKNALAGTAPGRCTTVTITKNLVNPTVWTRDRKQLTAGCQAIPAGNYAYTFVVDGEFAPLNQHGTSQENCVVVTIATTVHGEKGLTYVMPGAKYVLSADGYVDYCDPFSIIPNILYDPSKPDNPWNPGDLTLPPNTKTDPPVHGDCPCKDLLRQYGLSGIADMPDPDVELLMEWY